jgi:hypothetical protein
VQAATSPKIGNSVEALIDSQELAAAIRAGDQAKVAQLKVQLAGQVANTLTRQLKSKPVLLRRLV